MRRPAPAPSVVLALLLAAASPAAGEPPTAPSWKAVRDHVLPTDAEMAWRAIPWRPSFWEAVVDATREERPILLWAMNGHPLACT